MTPFNLEETLHYTSPAKEWSESLPVGNGRLGAMVYGGTSRETLQLNENSIWYGGPQDRTPKDAFKNLDRLRHFIRIGDHAEAEKLVEQAFFATPHSQRHYEPLGTLTLDLGHDPAKVSNYWRGLELSTANVTTEYEHLGVRYKRTVFASYPDDVLVVQLESSEKAEFTIRLSRYSDREFATDEFVDSIEAQDGTIVMHGTPGGRNSNNFCCVVSVQELAGDGNVETVGNCVIVNSSKAIIIVSAQTTFRHADLEAKTLTQAGKALYSHANLFKRHVQDYNSLYGRFKLRLFPDAAHIPTDERLLIAPDPGLVALYANYGRYLLISCSRPGDKALPATLQGLWNPSFQPAWGSKYTININTQMNYWPANVCNLEECEDPLFDLLERMAHRGEKTARVMYGCRGWTSHSCTDIWADTDPQDRWMPGTLWPMSGAWLCTHIWQRQLFGGDHNLKFLQRMFPVLRGSVQFILDFLIKDSTGDFLITSPSLSPENSYIDLEGQKGVLCEGSAIDIQIIKSLFEAFLLSVDLLQINDELTEPLRLARSKLPPSKVGEFGQLQEWLQDFIEYEPGHRHTSHLWSLYPGDSIYPSETPDFASAAEVTLRRRAENGGGHTGWSRAWLICLHARLHDADGSLGHIFRLLEDSTLPNLLDVHPPFQIDGNFGGCAGIVEMLIQSHQIDTIQVLPACPKEWRSGELSGVKARTGFELDIAWDEGVLTKVLVHSRLGRITKVVLPDKTVIINGIGDHRLV
ncbi:hypothetical protein BTUL_0062g00500 [Botrytis tulipae]|uniref:Uncharacterized protein n=1 Tax=Botrytis tulipae TaxID=87230 RepID=A0A4Z1ENJ4_9HELO|nr:hypothetical protein BTUL_0062g00500 [Botrytis tulipae]